MTREDAVEKKIYSGDLDDCIEALLASRELGESIVVEFNGHKLYSCDVTIDDAYQEITGMTKEEYGIRQKEAIENENQIPAGNKLAEKVSPERLQEEEEIEKSINQIDKISQETEGVEKAIEELKRQLAERGIDINSVESNVEDNTQENNNEER